MKLPFKITASVSRKIRSRVCSSGSTQADGSITRRFGGSGLGLSISYRLTALMNGTLSATSELGVGSRFVLSVELPICQEPGQTTPAQQDLETDDLADPVRILLVEDNPANQELIRALLASTGAEITTVGRRSRPELSPSQLETHFALWRSISLSRPAAPFMIVRQGRRAGWRRR